MKNNLHTELRKKWRDEYYELIKDDELQEEDIVAFWLSKLDELQSATSSDAVVKKELKK